MHYRIAEFAEKYEIGNLVEEGQLKDFAVSSVDRDKILIYEREA